MKIISRIILFFIFVMFPIVICNGEVTNSSILSEPYIFVTKWGSKGSGDGQFRGPEGIAVDSKGNVYVLDTLKNNIQKFDSSGNFITKWGSHGEKEGKFAGRRVAVDMNDNIYVTSIGNDNIEVFDSEGNFITEWGFHGAGDGQLKDPLDIAIEPDGNILIKDYTQYIKRFTPDGDFISKWYISNEFLSGMYRSLNYIAVDPEGNVYITYRASSFELFETVSENQKITHIDFTKWTYFAYILKYNSSGEFIAKLGSHGEEDGKFTHFGGLTVDSRGYLYVYGSHNCIQILDSEGNFITKWGSQGTGDGEFSVPLGIALDREGNVYVADCGNCRIQKFAPNPEFKGDN